MLHYVDDSICLWSVLQRRRTWVFLLTILAAVIAAVFAFGVSDRPASAQTGAPAAGNITVRDGTNSGEVIISFATVPGATHYRVGYVNMETDYLLAKASGTSEWIEAFIYADVDARNFVVTPEGRTQYTLRRLAQGVRHAFTVRTSDGLQREPTWPSNPRWTFHVVANRGGACPPAVIAAAASLAHEADRTDSAKAAGPDDGEDWRSLTRKPLYVDPSTDGTLSQAPSRPPGASWKTKTIGSAIPGLDGSGGRGSVSAQTSAPAAENIEVRDGINPGEVIISFDAVPGATHYRVGYVNMETDYPLAKASLTGEWIEAFIYVDVSVLNLTVTPEGRTKYTLRRLERGVRHAFTVRTSDGLQREPTWPSNPRWTFHVVANRGGVCPSAVPVVATSISLTGFRNGSWLEQNRPRAATAIGSLPWIGDGVGTTEYAAAEALIATARWYPDVFSALMNKSWVGDSVTDYEVIAIVWVRRTVYFSPQLADGILQKSWVQDAVSADEATVIRNLYFIARHPDELIEQQLFADAARILAMSFLDDVAGADAAAVDSLERITGSDERQMKSLPDSGFLEVMTHPRLSDGITDEEAKIVALLGGVYYIKSNNPDYPDLVSVLLDPTRITIEERAIHLPLSGTVNLAIVRTAPGAPRTMDLLEHSLRSVEEFMGAPLPTAHVSLLVEDAARNPFAAGEHFGTHIAIRGIFDVDDGSQASEFTGSLIAHEVAHYYWTRNELWINEGPADLVSFISENARVGRPIDLTDRYPCAYVRSLSELERLDTTYGTDESICFYSLGQRLFLDLYRSLGDAAFRHGFRQLYQASLALDADLRRSRADIDYVREAFQANTTPAGVIIARWYDGTEPYDLSHLDIDPVDHILPGINGQIAEASLIFEPDWPDGPGIDRFSASGLDEWLILRLRYTFPRTTAPKVQPLEYVQYYEDGFAFRRRVRTHTFGPDRTGGRSRASVGFSPESKWATGRYWVYVYDGARKVAEVTYYVTPTVKR